MSRYADRGLKDLSSKADHFKTSLVGRQHIVTGNAGNDGVTISNHFGMMDLHASAP